MDRNDFPDGSAVKKPPAVQEMGFSPWIGKTPWKKKEHPLQYSCLENLMDRGAWWTAVHRVAKGWT